MAKIRRDVVIRPPIIEGKEIIIKGNKGGEMRFSLNQRAMINPVDLRQKKRPLFINCYRTERFHYIDVSKYNGNKGEIIEVGVDGNRKSLLESAAVYIISPDEELIEYGEIQNNRGHKNSNGLFKYKTKITHYFREVKIICFENLYKEA